MGVVAVPATRRAVVLRAVAFRAVERAVVLRAVVDLRVAVLRPEATLFAVVRVVVLVAFLVPAAFEAVVFRAVLLRAVVDVRVAVLRPVVLFERVERAERV